MDKRYFSNKLAKWYEINKRALPWRETSDPYRIWLSEIILQQTRVAQGLPYYLRFVERFANVFIHTGSNARFTVARHGISSHGDDRQMDKSVLISDH